ncbi:hypothetical protein VSR01_14505 [Actinacidiphila sp. DG2A-62]|uniref:hypothetical protein n=1 Tax=Actinacidiphila sp. DG2A-62 TaxID=3108821 RepID=UPI002DBED5A5|nr:hypothetical protein [Actinacidiphila sp. DG2A-62]MEC3994669.1 hypothetical protein [Actinacidiphila sp. DG2A-62]
MATVAGGAGPGGDDGSGPGPLAAGERAELAALRRRFSPHHAWRAPLSALLITLAAVLAPLSAVAVWVSDEMADTHRYVATVAPLARQPDVRAAVTERVTDAITARIDLDALLSAAAPGQRPALKKALGALGGPITGGVRDLVRDAVARFVSSEQFARLWTQLNRHAHAAFTGALTGEGDTAVRVTGDEVVLDLAPVVAQVKRQLVDRGLTVAAHIPETRTDFTLVQSRDVRRVRTGFRALELAGNWLPAITVVLAGAGVLLAARRRRALVTAALAVAAGAAVLAVGLSVFRIVYRDHLPARTDERAAGAVYDQLVRFLRMTVRMVVTLGVVVALGAWLSGHGRRARRVRDVWESSVAAAREAAGVTTVGAVGPWVHRHRTALRWAVVVAACLAVLLWSDRTGQVVAWVAVAVVAALAVVEFLDEPGARGPTTR